MNEAIKKYFSGRELVIATKHGKEQVIAPLLERALGVHVVVPNEFDTDQFGTFSGEIERGADPLETARMKCRMACDAHQCSLAIASEGSFGPHPSLFFVPADDEIILLLDTANNLEYKARVVSTKTNFKGDLFTRWRDVEVFAQSVLFPSHALILKRAKDDMTDMVKGITSWEELKQETERMLADHRQVFVETDMRAMHNPTRMTIIAEATEKLMEKINSICPNCDTPGFDVVQVKEGLPCGQCGMPTRSILSLEYSCQKCGYSEDRMYPKGKLTEDPMHCDWCNP